MNGEEVWREQRSRKRGHRDRYWAKGESMVLIQESRVRAFFLVEAEEVGRGQTVSGSWLGKGLFWPQGPSQCCWNHTTSAWAFARSQAAKQALALHFPGKETKVRDASDLPRRDSGAESGFKLKVCLSPKPCTKLTQSWRQLPAHKACDTTCSLPAHQAPEGFVPWGRRGRRMINTDATFSVRKLGSRTAKTTLRTWRRIQNPPKQTQFSTSCYRLGCTTNWKREPSALSRSWFPYGSESWKAFKHPRSISLWPSCQHSRPQTLSVRLHRLQRQGLVIWMWPEGILSCQSVLAPGGWKEGCWFPGSLEDLRVL